MSNSNFPPPIVPAEISYRDATLYSPAFGDVYHSAEGAIAQARHVFIGGNELLTRWKNSGRFTIVETGFGSGLNFLATWYELNQNHNNNVQLDYVSVEKHPFRRDDLAKIHRAWPQFSALSRKFLDSYPPLVSGFHRIHLGDRVNLTLLHGDATDQLLELNARADAFYLDGFAPDRNPGMWSEKLFEQIGRVASPGATAASYTASGAVRRLLANTGFSVEKRPGFGRKRDMLVAQFPGQRRASRVPRKVVIIGAGIAGIACARSLTRYGIEVDLLDRCPQIGSETSSNPAALVRPFLTLDTSVRSRFSWSAFSYSVRCYRELDGRAGFSWDETGVLQLARDRTQGERLARAIDLHQFPDDLVRLVDPGEGTRLCGESVHDAGIWFSSAGSVNGQDACRAMLESGGKSIRFLPGADVVRIERDATHLRILDTENRVLGAGDSVILANATQAQLLVPGSPLFLRTVRGQLTAIPAMSRELRAPVSMDGYVSPVTGGAHYVGGTYEDSVSQPIVTETDRDANRLRAVQMFPELFKHVNLGCNSDWAGVRCGSRDYVPIVGEISEGIYGCLAMASRGFSWAPLAGEVLASALTGRSCPVERTIAEAIHPARLKTYAQKMARGVLSESQEIQKVDSL